MRPRKILAVVAALGLLVMLFLLMRRPEQVEPDKTAAGPSTERPVVVRSVPGFRVDPATGDPVGESEPAPVVDKITVEKQEVCEGEENLVTVAAHTVNGTDGSLRYVTLGQGTGHAFPLKSWLDKNGQVRVPDVRVFGRQNAMTDVKIPAFKVKKCDGQRNVQIATFLEPNTDHRHRIYARIVEPPPVRDQPAPEPFVPSQFRWEFGDGTTSVTEAGRVEHEFAPGSANERFWVFLIKVTVQDQAGHTLSGRTSLELMNHAFDALKAKGIVQIFTSMQPRYAEISPSGIVSQRFRLSHLHPNDVRLEAARVHWLGEGREEVVDAARIVGTTVIPAGATVEFELKVNTREHPKFHGLNVDLRGRSADGLPASGMASLMRPGTAPTRENHIPVEDPLLTAKILRARELLKQDIVSDEDLIDLERQGRFRDLVATIHPSQPQPVAPSEKAAWMPK